MATVTGYTAARMDAMEAATVISGSVSGTDLILVTKGGTQINAGVVKGDKGDTGTQGPAGAPGTSGFVGQICDFPKTPLPAGWLECDGTVYNIATYPALGAYLGNTFGGDGTNTFAVPNYKGRVRVHMDAAQTEFNAINKTGGEKTHILTIAELAVHTHTDTLAAPAHTHTHAHTHGPGQGTAFQGSGGPGPFDTVSQGGPGASFAQTGGASVTTTSGASATALTGSVGGASATALTGGINNTGSGAGHNNLPPYIVSVSAIKT